MATGEIEIANLALTLHLGRAPIASFDPAEPENPEAPSTETLMRLAYPNARDALLVGIMPNFAIRRVAPALLVGAPLYEFSKAYQLPQGSSDPAKPLRCLRVLDTNLDPTWGHPWCGAWGWPWPETGVRGVWQIEGRTLVTNEADIKLRYVGQVTDVTTYPPTFVMVFAKELAALVAYALTRDTNTALRLRKEANDDRDAAADADAREGSLVQLAPDMSLIRAREGGWW